jgi:hypothetical protein
VVSGTLPLTCALAKWEQPMNIARCVPALALAVAFALLPSLAHADDSDEKACPGLKEWKAAHPHPKVAADAKVDMPELRAELHQHVAADQKAREAMFDASGAIDPNAMEAMSKVDGDNLRWFKKIVAEHGFPTVAQVGQDGVGDAFLLVQHADIDPAFQASMLAVLETRLASGGFRKSQFAMLTDRVLIAQGKRQRYGSQYDLEKAGDLKMMPTEDPAHLDARRDKMDLPPIALYECALRASNASN